MGTGFQGEFLHNQNYFKAAHISKENKINFNILSKYNSIAESSDY